MMLVPRHDLRAARRNFRSPLPSVVSITQEKPKRLCWAPMMLLRQALRAMRTRPQLSLVAVALLALGIGANTTLFALADAVMFRPFPFAEQDRLVIAGGVQAGRRAGIPYPEFIAGPTRPHGFDDRDVSVLLVIGRLKAGVRIETAQSDVDGIVRELAAAYGRTGRMASTMAPLVDDAIGSVRIRLWALLAAAALLLTAAAANVAGLLLLQMSARRREFAVRMALGASVGAIARTVLCEAALLTALASGAAFVAARAALPMLLAIVPLDLPRIEEAVIGARAFIYTVGVGTFVTAVCALVPLFTLWTSPLEQTLRDGGRAGTGSRQNHRTRRLLVVGEMAIAVIILTCAALLYRSVASLTRLDVGFVADRLVAIEVHAPSAQTADRTKEHGFYMRVIDALRTVPSAESVAGVAGRPLKGPIGLDSSWQREGQAVEDAKRNPWANLETVTPGYFETMGIRLLEGRTFTDDDRLETVPVVVVGETFARRTWPGTSAIGKRLRGHGFDEKRAAPPWWTVVGVVADVRYRDLRSPSLDVYVPYDQAEFSIGDIVIRTRGSAQAAIAAIHARLRSVDPDGAVRIALMRDEIAREQTPWPANLLFFAFFAALTAFIAIVGLYGLLATVVAEQTREFGVRLALGATAGPVGREVIVAAGRTALVGGGLGLVA